MQRHEELSFRRAYRRCEEKLGNNKARFLARHDGSSIRIDRMPVSIPTVRKLGEVRLSCRSTRTSSEHDQTRTRLGQEHAEANGVQALRLVDGTPFLAILRASTSPALAQEGRVLWIATIKTLRICESVEGERVHRAVGGRRLRRRAKHQTSRFSWSTSSLRAAHRRQ